MRLKKLSIQGFKSFADRTVLQFDAGITCLVGPNGCGKSNIADAFRWVLGEQSAKSMRGTKMPDVIFAGTNQRKPLNFAEVSLTLSDIQGALPLEYEEVTLTRRLHRSGDSEYLLNGNPVRLKDLQNLFLDSGIGRNAFSIFEQGKLDQVINYSPYERRYIFEEAAGILRFLQRKREALKRLEQAELNLSRLVDIYQEVEKQIKVLESQANKARIFKEQKAHLELLEKTSYLIRWMALEKKYTELKTKQQNQIEHIEECQNKGVKLSEQNQLAKLLVQQHESALRSQSEKLLTLRGRLELELQESRSLQQQLKEGQQRERKLKEEWEELGLARLTRQKMLVEMKGKWQQLEEDWNEAEGRLRNRQEQVKEREKGVVNLRRELSIKQQDHLKQMQRYSQLQSELKQIEVRLENYESQQNQVEARFQQLIKDRQQVAQIVQERRQHLQQLSELIDSHKDRLEQYSDDLKRYAHEGGILQKEKEELRRKIVESKARQKVLLRMREEHEGFSNGSKQLLHESQNPESPLFRTLRPLYEYIEPEDEVVEALAVVLRIYAQTLVVECGHDFKRVLAYAQEADLQDYSLLCLEWLRTIAPPIFDNGNLMKNKVSSHPLTEHFLSGVTLAFSNETMLTDWLQGKCQEAWSAQGVFLDCRGVFFKVKPNENQVFIRESELKSLEEELDIDEEHLMSFEQALHQLQERSSQIQLERSELDRMLRRDEMKLVEVNFGLQRALADLEKNKTEQVSCEQEAKLLKQNYEDQKLTFQTLEQQYTVAESELVKFDQEKEALQLVLNEQEKILWEHQQDQKEKGELYLQLSEDRQRLSHQCNLLEAKEQDHDKRVASIEDEITELEEKQMAVRKKEQESLQSRNLFETQLQEAALSHAELEKQSLSIMDDLRQAEKLVVVHQTELNTLANGLSQLQLQAEHQQSALEALVNELAERYALSIEEARHLSLPLDVPLDQTEKQMKKIRQALQEAGDINLAAIEELENQLARYTFLKQQIEDMQQSKGELLKVIQQLEGESRRLFRETFEMIRQNFKKNFQILFDGGEADLQFTESQDVLEAGIEITAKPPGKQMRSISLLSGGEKCLTAVALLFAIFEVKPAPFCILDEIDAPLDDSNVERFVNVVKHFVNRCQFLIITHNKRTMAIGDILFGISMEEKGVSKLLSLEFAHQEGPVASLV